MSKSVIEVLTEARAKVAQGWCQGNSALDHNGLYALPDSPNACKFCMDGALLATREIGSAEFCDARRIVWDMAMEEVGPRGKRFATHLEWNDAPGRTQEEVLQFFDRAIAKAREPKVTTEEVVR